ncbi:FAD-dependent oxidoreductase [Scatolibacter rhodanostii]|uniref:FAD-dependent oxidoreductase n=1 Tax=Scatolibacter rhodanostii TaxID=2014781 RepID=UPI000C077560|nr:FAD-dependent oxidoreductase [Scatolibacter rhodanostii]
MTGNNLYDLVIIGSGPAGISAAIYAGRATLRTLIIDAGDSGGQITITSEVVNYPGILSVSGEELGKTFRQQAKNFGAEFLSAEVKTLDLDGDIKKVVTDKGDIEALSVIVATGARPRKLGFPGEKEYQGRGIGYCATCDGEFFTGKDIFVIGAGFAAAEEAIFLTRYAKKVYVIAREPAFTCSQSIAEEVLHHPKIEVHFESEILSASGDSVLRSAEFINNKTGEKWSYQVENPKDTFGIFVFIGYEPMSELLKGKVELDRYGYVPTNDKLETSAAGVYAAGDLRPKQLRQLVTAVSDGAVAATNAEIYCREKKQSLGITIEKSEPQSEENTSASESFFSADIVEGLKPVFDRLTDKVTLVQIDGGDSAISAEQKSFVQDIAKLTDKIDIKLLQAGENVELEKQVHADIFPLITLLKSDGTPVGITYHAVPGGHEFNSFILALYNTGSAGQPMEDSMKEKILSIANPVHVQVGVTLSCTMCPDVVQALQQIAAKNSNVVMNIVDVSKFADFKDEYNIMSVPAVVINQSDVVFGKKDMSELTSILLQHTR